MCDVAGFQRSQALLSASETALRSDLTYLRLLEAQSMWPTRYLMGRTVPCCSGGPVLGLNAPLGVGARQVDTYNKLLPSNMRVEMRAAQNRLHTQLFGTSPYMALGDGILRNVDTSTALLAGNWVPNENGKQMAEANYNRFDYITLPRALRDLPVETRYGMFTRMGPEYAQPHD